MGFPAFGKHDLRLVHRQHASSRPDWRMDNTAHSLYDTEVGLTFFPHFPSYRSIQYPDR